MTGMIKKLALEIRQIETEMAAAMAPFNARKKAVYRRAGLQKKEVKLEAHFLRLEASGTPDARAEFQKKIAGYMAALTPLEKRLTSGTENATRARRAHPDIGGDANG